MEYRNILERIFQVVGRVLLGALGGAILMALVAPLVQLLVRLLLLTSSTVPVEAVAGVLEALLGGIVGGAVGGVIFVVAAEVTNWEQHELIPPLGTYQVWGVIAGVVAGVIVAVLPGLYVDSSFGLQLIIWFNVGLFLGLGLSTLISRVIVQPGNMEFEPMLDE